MNSPDAFDDLARRTLEGRSFPFDEGHWRDMQRVLAAEQRRKRRGFYWAFAAALLLVGGGLAWMVGADEAPVAVAEAPASARTTEVNAPQTVPTPTASAPTTGTSDPAEATSTAPHAATPGQAAAPKDHAPRAATGPNAKATPAKPTASTTKRASAPRSSATNSAPSTPVSTAVAGAAISGGPAAPSGTQAPTGSTAEPTGIEAGSITPETPPAMAGTTNADATPVAIAAAAGAGTPAAAAGDAAQDSTLATATGVQDSAKTATPEAAAPPIIANTLPWEITAWGGPARSHTAYSGAEAPWPGTISDANAPAFGAEVMHMGRNIGLGAGLHYITYAEQYMQPELTLDVITIDPLYSLLEVDTTLLVVTGTVLQNGQIYYTTMNVDTTLYVLDISADTTTTTVRTQEAIDRVNKVSYLELPLLIDGHVDAGKWRFGLRGGPTVGLLTGRSGSVPITDPSGSVALSDQPFREYMFGWTVRGYIRYKLADRWWLGLEPMARGQLMNAYDSGELDRRSSSMGLGFSVSYRLP